MILSSAFWGASFIFTKGLFNNEQAITPLIILTGRMLIATVFTVPILWFTGRLEPIRKDHLKYFLLLAFTEPFLYSLCETGGVQFVSGSLASIIIATIPLFIPFAMALIYKEKIKANAVIGVLLSLGGITLMTLNDDFSFSASPKGLLLLASAVLIAVIYTLILVKVLDHYKPMTITCYQNCIGLIYFLPLMLVVNGDHLPMLSYSAAMWLPLLFLGIFCSTVAYMFYNYGMKHLGATAASVYNNIIPVFSLLLALAIGQESLNILKVLGMCVVMLGLTVAQKTFHKKDNKRKGSSF